MNYIDKWFHFYDTTESFELHKKQGLINPDSICFLGESGQIYTQNSLFGICRERFEKLEQLVLEHEAKIKNILGIEGPSIKDGIVNNIADLINFLDGFTDEDNLKDFIEAMKNALESQIDTVQKELSNRITSLEDSIRNDSDDLHNAINAINTQVGTINTRLDNHDVAIAALNTSLASHIREYNLLKTSYDNFKSYAETKFTAIDSSISSINVSIKTLQNQFTELDEKFDGVENEIANVQDLLEEAKQLVRDLETRFGEALADQEQFKKDVDAKIEDFKALIGAPNGIAPLDSEVKVPSAYLPSYVDDVLEYATLAAFPTTGESGKIYIALDTNLTYRWSGSTYVEVSKSLGLGETSSTAYPGNKGKKNADDIAAHRADTNNPHNVTKAQLGLNNVDNTRDIDKPISTAVQEALNNKVEIEPGKGLVSTEDAEKLVEYNAKIEQFEDNLQAEIDRATAAEGTTNSALSLHKSDNTNPHGVTKAQVGLGNVDNTSDLDKPISTATQTALDNAMTTVDSKIATQIANIVANAPTDFDTLKEIADWITTHADSASAMNTQIQANKTKLDNLNKVYTVSDIDNLKNPGIYIIKSEDDPAYIATESGRTIGANLLVVANGRGLTSKSTIEQTYYNLNHSKILRRTLDIDGVNAWSHWYDVTIGESSISNNAISTAKVQDKAITPAKLSDDAKLTSLMITGPLNNELNITVGGINKTTNINNLTYNGKKCIYKQNNEGFTNVFLISKLPNNYETAPNDSFICHGFNGNFYEIREGGTPHNNVGHIICIASYNSHADNTELYSSQGNYIPVIVKYNNEYYLAITVKGNNRLILFEGLFINCLDTFTELLGTDDSDFPPIDGLTYLYKDRIKYYAPYNAYSAEIAKGVKDNSITESMLKNSICPRFWSISFNFGNDTITNVYRNGIKISEFIYSKFTSDLNNKPENVSVAIIPYDDSKVVYYPKHINGTTIIFEKFDYNTLQNIIYRINLDSTPADCTVESKTINLQLS